MTVKLSQPSSDTTTTLNVSWNMATKDFVANRFRIDVYVQAHNVKGVNVSLVSYKLSYAKVISGLIPGEIYSVKITAVSEAVQSSPSMSSNVQRTGTICKNSQHLLAQILEKC